ncbi:MAG: polymer-forming cytoskeletal protein [Patescibacteria group bacterium]
MSKEKDIETIIGSTVKVEGDFKGQGDVVVEGQLHGKLSTKGNLSVGENAKIIAEVSANNVIIAGELKGNLKVKESLELTSTAQITGDIEAQILTIATGAKINGNIKMEEVRSETERKEKRNGE